MPVTVVEQANLRRLWEQSFDLCNCPIWNVACCSRFTVTTLSRGKFKGKSLNQVEGETTFWKRSDSRRTAKALRRIMCCSHLFLQRATGFLTQIIRDAITVQLPRRFDALRCSAWNFLNCKQRGRPQWLGGGGVILMEG